METDSSSGDIIATSILPVISATKHDFLHEININVVLPLQQANGIITK